MSRLVTPFDQRIRDLYGLDWPRSCDDTQSAHPCDPILRVSYPVMGTGFVHRDSYHARAGALSVLKPEACAPFRAMAFEPPREEQVLPAVHCPKPTLTNQHLRWRHLPLPEA